MNEKQIGNDGLGIFIAKKMQYSELITNTGKYINYEPIQLIRCKMRNSCDRDI